MIVTGSFFFTDGTPGRIARLNADGSFDATFAPGDGPDGDVLAFLSQPDGKIVVGGKFSNYNGTAANKIARINSDGSLDTSFVAFNPSGRNIGALAVQFDGKLLAGENDPNTLISPVRLFRLGPDGQLDPSFPITNTGVEPVNGSINSILMQPNGGIVIGGQFDVVNGVGVQALARISSGLVQTPTAASVSIGGRVTTADGTGIPKVAITLFMPDGSTKSALTTSFGYYRFDEIPVGALYVITTAHRRFTFAEPSRAVSLLDEMSDVNFVALPQP
jgi:uncharacterized delta-60 repeat protein